jgi:hypothetical protein
MWSEPTTPWYPASSSILATATHSVGFMNAVPD